ncbi:hypothetical protein ACN079_04820 [Pseudomonas sp. ABY48]|uniref:hypothetical protein n=1 Tax=Pseudomonas sp. ABY48 TaxID=3402865 RepID=UPI003B434390
MNAKKIMKEIKVAVADKIKADHALTEIKEVVRVERDGYWAELEVECYWLFSGEEFVVVTNRYRAADNSSERGKLSLSVVSTGDPVFKELTRNGVQDGEWRPLPKAYAVAGNALSASVYFHCVYDLVGAPDVVMEGVLTVEFPT